MGAQVQGVGNGKHDHAVWNEEYIIGIRNVRLTKRLACIALLKARLYTDGRKLRRQVLAIGVTGRTLLSVCK